MLPTADQSSSMIWERGRGRAELRKTRASDIVTRLEGIIANIQTYLDPLYHGDNHCTLYDSDPQQGGT